MTDIDRLRSLRENYATRAESSPTPLAQWSDIVRDLDRVLSLPDADALREDEDGAPYPAWVDPFVRWIEGHDRILDFRGVEVPELLSAILVSSLDPEQR